MKQQLVHVNSSLVSLYIKPMSSQKRTAHSKVSKISHIIIIQYSSIQFRPYHFSSYYKTLLFACLVTATPIAMHTGSKTKAISTSSFFSKVLSFISPKKHQKPTRPLFLSNLSTTKFNNEFERVFQYFDENGDGKISPTELQNSMRNIGEDISTADAEAVVALSDSDGDGLLEFEEFVKLVQIEDEEKGEGLKEAFQVYEMEGEGCITPKSLRRALSSLGEKKSIEECKVMIRRFDLNGDGVLSFDEFRVMMV